MEFTPPQADFDQGFRRLGLWNRNVNQLQNFWRTGVGDANGFHSGSVVVRGSAGESRTRRDWLVYSVAAVQGCVGAALGQEQQLPRSFPSFKIAVRALRFGQRVGMCDS